MYSVCPQCLLLLTHSNLLLQCSSEQFTHNSTFNIFLKPSTGLVWVTLGLKSTYFCDFLILYATDNLRKLHCITFLSVCEDRRTGHTGRVDSALLTKTEAGCADHSSVELDAGMCGFPYSFSSLPLWCQVVLPTLSQTTIRAICFLFTTRTKMT